MSREVVTAEVVLGERVPLDHRPHGAIEDQDALAEEALDGWAFRRPGPRTHGPHRRTLHERPLPGLPGPACVQLT